MKKEAKKVYAVSIHNEMNLEKDKEFLIKRKISFRDSNIENVIIINEKYFYSRYGKWKPIGKYQWYGSRGIEDFLERFF